MKCPFCGGSGKRKTWVATDTLSEYEQPCFKCHGSGEIEQTKEEYIHQCSTEELAKEIMRWYELGVEDGKCTNHAIIDKEWVVKWLKEKHSNE